jgi:energy-coupling factor transporter ATP-binding protein EcfA2
MIKTIKVGGFGGVAYLEGPDLMRAKGGKVQFSTKKPNVLVGPNGSGKSALMTTLALLTMSYFTGKSELSSKYLTAREADSWWTRLQSWGHEYAWLQGVEVGWDIAPAVYYRPEHIPGNEVDPTHAMLMGYFEEAKAYARMTDAKSCGQKSGALLERICTALRGQPATGYGMKPGDWSYGVEKRSPQRTGQWVGEDQYKAEVLKATYLRQGDAGSIVLMDEPERSLDGRAEMGLWKAIEAVNCSKVQVIVATHSVYPALHPDRFHVIEAEKGYLSSVKALLHS